MVFDNQSPQFVSLYDELPLWSAPFAAMILDAVPMRPDMAVLDIGAGTGFLSLELAQRLGEGSRVTAVDIWPAALGRLREKIDFLSIDNLDVELCDAADLPFADDEFDLVVSNLGVNNFADPCAVAAECFRVLQPGGELILTTNLVGHMAEFYAVFEEVLNRLGLAKDRLMDHVAHRGTRARVEGLLSAAGFELGGWEEATGQMRFACGQALLDHFLMQIGFRPAWEQVVEEADRPGVFAAIEEGLDAMAASKGELQLTIPRACARVRRPA